MLWLKNEEVWHKTSVGHHRRPWRLPKTHWRAVKEVQRMSSSCPSSKWVLICTTERTELLLYFPRRPSPETVPMGSAKCPPTVRFTTD